MKTHKFRILNTFSKIFLYWIIQIYHIINVALTLRRSFTKLPNSLSQRAVIQITVYMKYIIFF